MSKAASGQGTRLTEDEILEESRQRAKRYGRWCTTQAPEDDLMISGISGMLPDSRNLNHFRDNLYSKVDMVSDDTRRWINIHPDIPDRSGKLYDIEKFDAGYFGVHNRQTHSMDPMARLVLEKVVEAVMDAGVNPKDLAGTNTGVFVGSSFSETEKHWYYDRLETQFSAITGCTRSMIAHRISYHLKLQGPSHNVDTACSSSIYAIDHAYKALKNGSCDSALAIGVNLCLHPFVTLQFQRLGVLSKTGTCRVFDVDSDGYVRSEAVGVIFLQKRKVAKRTYAQLIHTKTNQDGYKAQGITFPSTAMQETLLREFYEECGVDPTTLSYMEAHGTATVVGDPEEVNAIDRVFCTGRNEQLLIGSVKSNVGHGEPSSGFASLAKVTIAMENNLIPPNLHFTRVRPGVSALEDGRLKVVVESTPFQDDRGLVGINSFGFGGSNGHLLVKWNPKKKINGGLPRDDLPRLVCMSGRVAESVSAMQEDLNDKSLDAECVRLYHDLFKDDFPGHLFRGYTLISKSGGELARSMKSYAKSNKVHLGFGELSWSKVANELYQLPLFVGSIQKMHDILIKKKVNITDILMHNKPVNAVFNQILGNAAVQIALVDVLKAIGLKPDGLMKHGFGQLLCSYFEGALTFEQVLKCALSVATIMNQSADIEVQQKGQEHQNGNVVSDKQNGNYKNLKNLGKQVIEVPNEVKFTFESVKNFKTVRPKLMKALEDVMAKAHLEQFVDSLAEPKPVQVNEGVVFAIGQIPNLKNTIIFDGVQEHSTVALLKTLGELYEQGQNFTLDLLYPKVEYPVSRGTSMISPLVKWNHEKDWHVTKFKQMAALKKGELQLKVNTADDAWTFVEGHVIDGRNLFPATGYLEMVWRAIALKLGTGIQTNMQVVFEDCRFHRATTVSNDRTSEFTVLIQDGSGNFEIIENDQAIVTGRVRATTDLKERQLNLPEVSEEPGELPLMSKDVYKELRLRGYNYSGSFRAVTEVRNSACFGKIRWEEDSWVTFMDNMLQLQILQLDTRLLYVPTCIKYLSIDGKRHLEYVNELGEDVDLPVYLNKESGVMQCGGIEIRGLKASSIAKRKQMGEPVLEKYVFVPNHAELPLTEAVRTNMQLILENTPMIKIKVVELMDEATRNAEPLAPMVYQAIADMPIISPEIKLFSKEPMDLSNIAVEDKKLTTESDCNLIIGTNLLQRSLILAQALEAIKSNGYLLSRESVDFKPSSVQDFHVLTTYVSNDEKLVLFRKLTPKVEELSIQITPDVSWLQPLQDAVKNRRNVIVYAENEPLSGILGLVNCIRREPESSSVRCVFTFDNAPKFDLANPFYADQLRNNLAVNVFKNSKWGTYRHLRLENVQTVEREHCYVNTLTRGDLSTMRWIEGPLTTSTKLNKGAELVTIYYSSINFRDIMTASGRINVDSVVMDRLKQDCIQGFEFAGRTQSGKRVMGMTSQGALATLIEPDTSLLWPVPSSWTLEEAATVPVVYGTLIYAMYLRTQIKAGDSILIHSGSGGVGQAAIHLALHQGCTVFTTVGTQDKREYLLKKFPKLNDKNIGNSRDISFEQMIHSRTQGRGVDFVINSLAEEKLQASVRCLAKGGRFLEIGKFDMQSDNALQMLFFEKQASFHGIMLDRIFYGDDEDNCKADLGEILHKLIGEGAIQPLERTVFLENEIEQAHRYMMSGKHMGKVLVKLCQEEPEEIHVPPKRTIRGIPRYHCDPDKVYLITGGLGGFGLELADWLVLRGARKLVLTSRSGVKTGYQAYRIKLWKSYGVLVSISTVDITRKSGCEELIRETLKLGDLAAIFNLAVVLRDALLENQSVESFEVSFGPKANSTLYLDEITRKLCPGLRDFVVFSSVSCGRGNAGQSNYGMSNSVMERICERRREQGFGALAIEWGAIGDVGIVAEMQEEHTELEIGGTLQQKISSCIEVLDVLLVQENAVVASMVVAQKHGGGMSSNVPAVVAQILGIKDLKTVSLQSTLSELGMDSMTAVEIKQTLEREFEVFLTPQDIRTLTFARLHEIHEELATGSSGAGKSEKAVQGFEMLIQNLIEEGQSEDMKQKLETGAQPGTAKRPHVILLPGIEGTAKTFQPLASNLLVDATSLQYCCDKMEDTVEDIANNLLPTVEGMLSKSDPFHIIGYSYGTVLATEIVSKLEKKGYTGKLACIDGSPEFLHQVVKNQMDTETDAELQTGFLCHVATFNIPIETVVKNKERIFKCANFEERLQVVMDINPKDSKHSVDHLKMITRALYKRINAVKSYRPVFKIKSPIELFKPTNLTLPGLPEDYKLSDLAALPVDTKVFQGNHVTILENIELAQTINEWAGMVASGKE